jgi:uncharacterized protein YuzE
MREIEEEVGQRKKYLMIFDCIEGDTWIDDVEHGKVRQMTIERAWSIVSRD